MPSSVKSVRTILESLPKDFQGTIYELGSGWGTLALALAKKRSDCLVIGFETSLLPYGISRLLLFVTGQSNLQFKRKNFMAISLAKADMIVCYLYPGAMVQLSEKLKHELPAGKWIISNTFALPGWVPYAVFETKDLYRSAIYLYKTGS